MTAATSVELITDVDTYTVLIHASAAITTLEADGSLTLTLTPDQAQTLEVDLYDAAAEPELCVLCESYSTAVVQGSQLCHAHARSYDQAAELSS